MRNLQKDTTSDRGNFLGKNYFIIISIPKRIGKKALKEPSCHLEKWQWKRSLNFSTHTHTHKCSDTHIQMYTNTIKLNIKSILFLYTQFCSCAKLLCHFYRDAAISSNSFFIHYYIINLDRSLIKSMVKM